MDGCSAINLNLMWQPIINVGLAEEKARETNEERSKRQREEDEKGKGEQGRKGEVETGEEEKKGRTKGRQQGDSVVQKCVREFRGG